MMKRCWLLLWLLCLWPALAHAAPPTVTDVAKELVCDCPDCGKQSVDQCTDCERGKKYRAEIAALLQQGQGKRQILDHFADTYGEHMLGAPRPRGINRLAPLVPLGAALLGLLPVMLLLRHRRRVASTAPPAKPTKQSAPPATPNATDDPRVAAALREFDY